jgi:hypothetical protein
MPEPDPLEADMMRGAALAVHRRADRQAHFLEVKTPTGRLSDDQREIMDTLGRLGAPVMTVASVDDVRRAFSRWGIETEARHG